MVNFKQNQFFDLFYQNDIENLMIEKNNKILKKYLDQDYSQNLINRQKEIDEILIEYYNNKLTLNNEKQIQLYLTIFKILKLYNSRNYI